MNQNTLKIIIVLLIKNVSCFAMLAPIDQSLDLGIQNAIFPKEIFIAIGAPRDEARDTLRPVCRFLSQKLSIKGSYLKELITHPLFRTNSKTLRYLAFNAAWDADDILLKSLMRNMKQRDYVYQYELAERWNSKFGLERMVQAKMPDQYNEIDEVAKSYGCDLGFYLGSNDCTELKMACYNKDVQLFEELLNKDGMNHDLENILYMAIDKNSAECIGALLSYIKNKIDIAEPFARCKIYQNNLEVAIKNQKDKAFEALIVNNVWVGLNFVYPIAHGGRFTVLDWIVEYVRLHNIPNGNNYIEVYEKHGGKRYGDLPCIIS